MIRSAYAAASNVSRSLTQGWDRRGIAAAGLYLALYVLLYWLSYVRPLLTLEITPWNPQAGLTLAFLLLYGSRWLPVTVIAELVAEALVHDTPVPRPLIFIGSLWIGLAYGVLAAILRRQQLAMPVRTALDAAHMAAISVAGTLVVAAVYVCLFIAAGILQPNDALPGIARYWVGMSCRARSGATFGRSLPNSLQLP
jgi:two-component system sensor kinase FixL